MSKDRDRLHLEHIIDAAETIQAYTEEGREAFFVARMTRDAVVRNLEVIGEAAKRLSQALRDQAPEIPWRQICGPRDVVIHQYNYVDYNEVWNVVENDLPGFLQALRGLVPRGRTESRTGAPLPPRRRPTRRPHVATGSTGRTGPVGHSLKTGSTFIDATTGIRGEPPGAASGT